MTTTTPSNEELNAAVWRWFASLFFIKVAQHVFTWWLTRKVRQKYGG